MGAVVVKIKGVVARAAVGNGHIGARNGQRQMGGDAVDLGDGRRCRMEPLGRLAVECGDIESGCFVRHVLRPILPEHGPGTALDQGQPDIERRLLAESLLLSRMQSTDEAAVDLFVPPSIVATHCAAPLEAVGLAGDAVRLVSGQPVGRMVREAPTVDLRTDRLVVGCRIRAAVRALLVRPIEPVNQVGHPA